jgi:hypothetical protein
MEYFDYESVARQAKLSPEQIKTIVAAVRRDYPSDEMLFELHALRACRAILNGILTFEEMVEETARN